MCVIETIKKTKRNRMRGKRERDTYRHKRKKGEAAVCSEGLWCSQKRKKRKQMYEKRGIVAHTEEEKSAKNKKYQQKEPSEHAKTHSKRTTVRN